MKTLVVASALSALAGAAIARSVNAWDMTAQTYFRDAGVSGTTATGQRTALDFPDILDTHDFALMGPVVAHLDRGFTFSDLIDQRMSEGKNAAVAPSIPVAADAPVQGCRRNLAIGLIL